MRVLDLGTRIAPFGDPVGEVPLCDVPLAERRIGAVEASGVDAGRLTFADYAIASAGIIAKFVARAARGRPSALALPDHPAWASLIPVSSVRRTDGQLIYDVFCDADPNLDLQALRAAAEPVLVELSPATRSRPLPRLGPGPHQLEVVADAEFAMHVEHWVHVLWAAPLLVAGLVHTAAGRRRRGRRGTAASRIGPRCDIHPTAWIEGSVIGEGTEIGAGCVIRHSYVGPKSRLSDFTKAGYSVLGAGTHTLADANFEETVALGGGTLTNLLLQDSLLGRQVFLTTGVTFWRDALGETISVDHHGESVDTGRIVLGGCAGHGAVLGARTIVAPGRALPNRITVVMRKEEGVARIEDLPPGAPMCWYDGALVSTQTVDPEYSVEELER